MAKKAVKRKVSGGAAKAVKSTAQEVETSTVVASPTAAARPSYRRVSAPAEFNPDYTHVVNDLKRIGIMAGTGFVILIVLSFFIK